jgi:hypothetical protein
LAARWVLGHLDEPKAEAPTPLARLLAEQARQDLGKFLLTVDSMERAHRGQKVGLNSKGTDNGQQEQQPSKENGDAPPLAVSTPQQAQSPSLAAPATPTQPSRRVKRLVLPAWRIAAFLSGRESPPGLPFRVAIVGCIMDRGQGTVTLTIEAEQFDEVANGARVPTLVWES